MMWDHEASAEEIALAEQLFEEAEVILKDVRSRDVNEEDPEIQKLLVLYTQLTDIGCIDAMYAMGFLYHGDSHYILQDRDKALYWFEEAANQGHEYSMYKMAELLQDSNPKKAYVWLNTIRDMDNPMLADAYYLKAEMMRSGKGCIKDPEAATELYMIAAFRGNHYKAQLDFAMIYLGNAEWKRESTSYDIFNAAYSLERATENERKSSNKHMASYYYAQLLYEGRGVRPNFAKAYELFYTAAKKGCKPALFELAKIYLSGDIFEPDYKMAYRSLLLYQAYPWAELGPETDAMMQAIKENLSKADILRIQQESRADYFADSLSAENYLRQHSDIFKVEEEESAPEDEIEDESSVDEKAFQGVDEIRAGFERDKVCLRIWLDKPIKAGAPLDFETLKVKYDKRPLQIKHMPIYGNLSDKITPKTRNLLFRLAVARHLKQDDALVASIIKSASRDDVTSINRLFGLIFPNCWSKDSPAIKRSDGKLLIGLEIHRPEGGLVDTWIKHARDYDDLLHEKPENKDSRKKK